MSNSFTLRDMALSLDEEAIGLAQDGQHKKAKAAVELAIALETRHRQTLDVGWPKS
ncbi:hypothetical protein [Rhodococcus sp. OAS809]|uniref:hypothetical protein n=1 Tax=Rhodococcus sp. OAS809 TaxID=2663874 RepID=UPI001789F9CA